jgi:hypothetical protein
MTSLGNSTVENSYLYPTQQKKHEGSNNKKNATSNL